MNDKEQQLLKALNEVEDKLLAYRVHATNGIHPELRKRINQIKFTADSVLQQTNLIFGQQEVIKDLS